MAKWHLRFSSERRGTLFPTEASRRRAVHALVRAVGPQILGFSFVVEHGHSSLREDEARIKRLGRRVQLMLSAVADEPLTAPWIEELEGSKRVENLLRYELRQVSHHEVEAHPALWSGSSILDLVGARVLLPGLRQRVKAVLPYTPPVALYNEVGLPRSEIDPLGPGQVRVLGAARLVVATAAALAVGPELAGRGWGVTLARRAVAHLGAWAGIAREELGWGLAVTRRHLRRLLELPPPDEEVLRAVRVRLALEETVVRLARGITVSDIADRFQRR